MLRSGSRSRVSSQAAVGFCATHYGGLAIDRFHEALAFAQRQVRTLIERHPDFFPMYTTGGKWDRSGERWTDWCGGFLAGMMWNFSRQGAAASESSMPRPGLRQASAPATHSGTLQGHDRTWRELAEHYSSLLEHRKHDRDVHDLGFIFLNTYRRWHEVSGDPNHMAVVVQAGRTLAGRFQPKGCYLASFLGPQSLFVDIMMNVPLLFVAAQWLDEHPDSRAATEEAATSGTGADQPATADELRRIATAHCLTSQQYLVRPDGSTAHEAIFDTNTGEFLRQSTQQGLGADSCWSRGLAWALYGFGSVFRLTGDRQYLDTACRCADYFLEHLPAGHVPYWDFDLPPGPDRLWDSSAGAIAASGLLQLSEIHHELKGRDRTWHPERQPQDLPAGDSPATRYQTAALQILTALCTDEFLGSSVAGWEGILRHGIYHFHKKLGVDESVMWGDHFFVEALVKAVGQQQ